MLLSSISLPDGETDSYQEANHVLCRALIELFYLQNTLYNFFALLFHG